MKHIATVPAALVKAAMLFQAKQDVRYYLNGVYITQDHIVATNGHAMFVAPYESELRPETPIIVAIKSNVPARAYNLELLYDEETKIGVMRGVEPTPLKMKLLNKGTGEFEEVPPKAMAVMDSMGHPKTVFFQMVDGKFPDWRRVIPTGDLVPTDRIGINFGYADLVAKACKELGSKFAACAINLRGPTTSIEIELSSPEYQGAKAIIMPCRL